MENFIEKSKEWLKLYGDGSNLNNMRRRELSIRFKELQREYDSLGDLRVFVRNTYWDVAEKYLVMPKPVIIKKPRSISIREIWA